MSAILLRSGQARVRLKMAFEHRVKFATLTLISIDRVIIFDVGIDSKMMGLPRHRPHSPDLPEQPLQALPL